MARTLVASGFCRFDLICPNSVQVAEAFRVPITIIEKTVLKAISDSKAGVTKDVTDAGRSGLILRAAPRGATWLWRYMWDGKYRRLKLGPVSVINLTAARAIAAAAREYLLTQDRPLHDGWVRDQLMMRRLIARPSLDVVAKPPPLPLPKPNTWTFPEAREAFLDEVKRTLRPGTLTDRRGMLGIQELAHLAEKPVALITRSEIAAIVADIFRSGRERHAGKLAEVIRPMWTWLADQHQQKLSGVREGAMVGLKPPKATNRESRDEDSTYLPLPAELGRVLAIIRAGAIHPTTSDAALLLLFTSQRRRTIVTARRSDFIEEGGVLVWQIPARFMKTGRGKKRSHDLPLPTEAAAMVRRRLANAHEAKTESPWLFPGVRPRKAGDAVGHLHADSLTHIFADLPDVTMAPHDTRRGFTTYLEDLLGLDQQILKTVLDHSEGKASNDVTDAAYSKARRLKLKTTILTAWSGFLMEKASKVVLEDLAVIKKAITAARVERARLSAKNPRPKRSRPGRYQPKKAA
jgi:integrase